MPGPKSSPSKRTTIACVACRKRKVRCNGQTPCQQCQHHGLRCAHPAPTDKTRSGIRRGHIMSDYRQAITGNEARPLAPNSAPFAQKVLEPPLSDTENFLQSLVPKYTECVYTTHPIITESELLECIQCLHSDVAAAAFACSAIAATIHLTPAETLRVTEETRSSYFHHYVGRACNSLEAHKPYSPITVRKAMTHLFLANCLLATGDRDTAFIYLRQAATISEVLLSNSTSVSGCTENARLRRLYWLVFIHERYECISESRQTILKPLPETSVVDEDLAVNVRVGFERLVKLFLLLDDTFIAFWTGRDTRLEVKEDWVAQRRDAFLRDEQEARMEQAVLSTAQCADLIVTRHWLLAMLWRIAMSHNMLRDLPPELCFSLLFPLHVSEKLRQMLEHTPTEAVLINGAGIVQKLFEVTDTVADVILHVSSTTVCDSTGEQLDNFLYLRDALFAFSHLDPTRKSIIEEKALRIEQITSTAPSQR